MTSVAGVLPQPRGALSEAVSASLGRDERGGFPGPHEAGAADPLGEDLQLALFLCYEPHHSRDPELLRLRTAMERVFLGGLHASTAGGNDVRRELAELLTEPIDGIGISQYLAARGEKWQLREYLTLRSVRHPRAAGPGIGSQRRLDDIPASMLAVGNLRSLFGLHHRLRGAFAGHRAVVEATAKPEALLLDRALRRLGASRVPVVLESAPWQDSVRALLAEEPSLAEGVVFGIQATVSLEAQLAAHVLAAWHMGTSALR